MTDQDHPTPSPAPKRAFGRRHARSALAAVLLTGTALGGYALGHSSPAAEPTQAQDHVIRPTPPAVTMPDFANLVKQVEPAVVSVTTKLRSAEVSEQVPQLPFALPFPFGNGEGGNRGFFQFGTPNGGHAQREFVEARGSGFIIDSNGTIVTNNHVVNDAKAVTVTLSDGTELPAKVIGRDPRTDLAVLKVVAGHKLPYVELGNSADVQPGQWVIAIGNPFGLGDTVTAGIVSARGRDIGAGPYDNFIQVDAPINRGNSGGPLFTQHGEVIGVTTAILSPTGGSIGIGFAIPSDTVKQVVAQLQSSGHVVRGYLGVEAQRIAAPMAAALNVPQEEGGKPKGALIATVQPDSPAERAGLKPGDVIETVNGQPIADPRALAVEIAGIKPGSQATVRVLRNGNSQEFNVTIGTLPNEKVAENGSTQSGEQDTSQAKVGLAVQPLTPELREQLDLPAKVKGAVIAQVTPGSPAEQAGLQQGDVIVGVGTKGVTSADEAVSAIKDAAHHHRSLALRVVRNGQAIYVAIDLAHPNENAGNSEG
ncbi:MAG: DegQ family serine endoprotease [Alphaproteobacteria bacterium]|nr:DegQ family serine endoprotease [Alphaproteobacteria bacterium]